MQTQLFVSEQVIILPWPKLTGVVFCDFCEIFMIRCMCESVNKQSQKKKNSFSLTPVPTLATGEFENPPTNHDKSREVNLLRLILS